MLTRTLIILTLIFLVPLSTLDAQTDWQKYVHVKDIKFSSVPQLAYAITDGLDSDREKVEAIYFWVTHNIAYDYKMFLRNKEKEKKKKSGRYSEAALAIKEQGMALSALKSGKGICHHYALIMRDLCMKVGVQTEIVLGYGKTDPMKTRSSGEKHAWNAVRIDNEWLLLEPTWGSGFIDENEKFQHLFNGDYAFVKPEVFDMNHFPKEMKWQLASTRLDRTAYRANPVIGAGYLKYKINDLSPKENVITATQGDTINIQFSSPEEIEEIKCRNLKTSEEIPTSIEADKDKYKLMITTEALKSGNYCFFHKRKALFTYRITVSRSTRSSNKTSE